MLAGEMAMAVSAHNLGKVEVAMGADYLRELEGRMHVPFISDYMRDASGKRVIEKRQIVSVGKNFRIGIIGVVSARYASAGITIDDPRQAILDAAGAMKAQGNALVVLAYLA